MHINARMALDIFLLVYWLELNLIQCLPLWACFVIDFSEFQTIEGYSRNVLSLYPKKHVQQDFILFVYIEKIVC